jgi:hypothetical protein
LRYVQRKEKERKEIAHLLKTGLIMVRPVIHERLDGHHDRLYPTQEKKMRDKKRECTGSGKLR